MERVPTGSNSKFTYSEQLQLKSKNKDTRIYWRFWCSFSPWPWTELRSSESERRNLNLKVRTGVCSRQRPAPKTNGSNTEHPFLVLLKLMYLLSSKKSSEGNVSTPTDSSDQLTSFLQQSDSRHHKFHLYLGIHLKRSIRQITRLITASLCNRRLHLKTDASQNHLV